MKTTRVTLDNQQEEYQQQQQQQMLKRVGVAKAY